MRSSKSGQKKAVRKKHAHKKSSSQVRSDARRIPAGPLPQLVDFPEVAAKNQITRRNQDCGEESGLVGL